MISDADRALVLSLHAQNFSIRETAKRTGLARTTVHRIVATADVSPIAYLEQPLESDDGDDTEALLDADPERVAAPPLTFVGTERVRGAMTPRWVDTVGPVDEMAIYRYRFRSGSEGDAELAAGMARQLVAAGWWQQDHGGYYGEWMPPPAPADTRCDCSGHRDPARVWSYTPHDGRALAGTPYDG